MSEHERDSNFVDEHLRPADPPPPSPRRHNDTPTPPRGQPAVPPPPQLSGATPSPPPPGPTPAPTAARNGATPPPTTAGEHTESRHAQLPPPRPWESFGATSSTGTGAPVRRPTPPPLPPGWGSGTGQASSPPAPTPAPPEQGQPATPPQPEPRHDTGGHRIPAGWPPQPSAAPPSAPQQPGWGWPATPPSQRGQFSYVDSVRQGELVPTRKIPPGRGWRRALYLSTFKLINPGRSADERRQHDLEAKVRSLLRGHYKIGILGKGGAGKTTVAAGVGSTMALLRQDDRVVAIDADTAFGKLGARIDPTAAGSYWELAADEHLDSFTDVRSRVGSNAAGLFVLPGEQTARRRRILDPDIYRRATYQLDRHFTVSIVDCGSTMDSVVTEEVLKDLDALIVVTTPWYDAASAASQTMDWLDGRGLTGLLNRTVVVVNDADGRAEKKIRALVVEHFTRGGQTVIELPYDPHLRPGGVIDIVNELHPDTRRRFLEIAAAIAEHFASTTDGPRARR